MVVPSPLIFLAELAGVSISLSGLFCLSLQNKKPIIPRASIPSGKPTPSAVFVPKSELPSNAEQESVLVTEVAVVAIEVVAIAAEVTVTVVVMFSDVKEATKASLPGLKAAPVDPRVNEELQQEISSSKPPSISQY